MNRLSKYLNIALLATLSLVAGGCDDNSNDGPIDLFEVIVNKPMVRIGQNEVATVNIILGNEGYSVKSYDTSIAAASIENDEIRIESFSKNGATTVEVTDSEGVTADISVNVGLFDLEANFTEIEMETGNTCELFVSMGNFSGLDELKLAVSDESVIRVSNTDKYRPYYLVEGLKVGEATITFTDRKEKQLEIPVTILPISIEISDAAPTVGVNNKVQIEITKGNGGYVLTPDDETIVAIEKVNETTFALIGKKAGETVITVTDQAGETATISVRVNEANRVANLGSNNYFSVPFRIGGGTVDQSMSALNSLTYEVRFRIDTKNGSDHARINTLLGVEKICLLRVDVHKNGSDNEKRYLQLAADDKGGIRFEGKTEIQTGVWYNAAVVIDESKSGTDRIALYLNGKKEELQLTQGTTSDLRNINLTNNFFIGRSDNKRPLNGAISYARIWTKALSDTEIADQQNEIFTDNRSGLVANWLFNNGNGTTQTFVSLTGQGFEAIGGYAVTSWTEDPILQAGQE